MSAIATTVRKFCTLTEAAERLNITEEQIENLLKKGVLHEFRDGPHRLLRTADVGAIVAARTRRLERQGQPLTQSRNRPRSPQDSDRSTTEPNRNVQVTRPPNATERTSRRNGERPRTITGNRSRRTPGSITPARRPALSRSPEPSVLSDRRQKPRPKGQPDALPPRPNLSLREWFWTGLIQDNPIAIALLTVTILLALAGAVVGAWALADALR